LVVLVAVALPAIFLSQWSLAYAASLPDVSQLSNDVPGDTYVYASDNKTVLADLHPAGYQHYFEPLSDMGRDAAPGDRRDRGPELLQRARCRSSRHRRAAIVDIKAGDTREGASTITQQLVKVRLLYSSPTIQRKVTEAVLAFAVEHKYSKDQILEMYLNSVSFGNTAVGTAAASQIFFHKKTSQLDLAQASMLAGLVKGPTLYSPFQNWEGARARQHDVLAAMVDAGKVSQAQADAAFKEDISPPAHMFKPSSTIIARVRAT
jgi:membrane peptidoglycan carboxypeptidase